jgi:uncharacterized protein YpmB
MSYKDKIKNHQPFIYSCAILFLFICSGLVTFIFLPRLGYEELLKNYFNYKITDIIAIITIFVLALGVSTYFGIRYAMRKKYRFIELDIGIKENITILGSMFLLFIANAYFFNQYTILNILNYIYSMTLIAFLFGYIITMMPEENEKVTLKMVVCDESGCKKLEKRENLELYQTTDKDYRFKDASGKEFIIPIGKIQEIERQEV